jgi:hypothetical protein
MKKRSAMASLIFVLLLCPGILPSPDISARAIPAQVPSGPAVLPLNSLPVHFIENRGQVPGPAGYLARFPFGTVRFTSDEIVFQFIGGRRAARGHNIRMSFAGTDKNVRVEPQEQIPARFNFFGGNDPAKWTSGVPAYKRILYRDLYPGIDLLILGGEGRLKHEYKVKPGARVEDIRILYSGARDIRIDKAGQLDIDAGVGSISEGAPVSYQIINGEKRAVLTAYNMDASGTVGFAAGPFDRNADLIIDPVLQFSSYLGGSTGDAGNAIAVDLEGNVYIAGSTYSSNFPTTAGAFDTGFGGVRDAFVSKFDPTGSDLIYSTFLGGSSDEGALAVTVDFGGNACVCGFTDSSNFPTTVGAYDRTPAGQDAWLTKLNASGSGLVYSTLLGGTAAESALDLAVDQAGNAYLTGFTASGDFPTTPGAYDPTAGMQDAFLAKFNPSGTGLAFSTFFGGSDDEWGYGIALGPAEEVFLTGITMSTDLPTTSGAYDRSLGGSQDVFVA